LVVPKENAQSRGRKVLKKLKKHLPRQPFPQKLQARMEGRIIAREDIKALKKDVTEDLYGGDYTRKKKLLKNQREGQQKLAQKGSVEIPKEVYHKLLDFS
jgi:GTP-binding protein LepA